jgi:hypothetical protein
VVWCGVLSSPTPQWIKLADRFLTWVSFMSKGEEVVCSSSSSYYLVFFFARRHGFWFKKGTKLRYLFAHYCIIHCFKVIIEHEKPCVCTCMVSRSGRRFDR